MKTSEANTKRKTGLQWLWPSITDIPSAKQASRQGYGASIFVAVITAIIATVAMFRTPVMGVGVDSGAFLDAGMFAIVAWRIYRFSRAAAIAGLALYLFERVSMWAVTGPSNPFMALLITMMFINSIRGTFALKRLVQETKPVPSNIPQVEPGA